MDKDIKLAEDYYEFQKKEWIVSRTFWALAGLILAAAGLGFFGKGPVSDKEVTVKNIRFEYNKFMRVEKATELIIEVPSLGETPKVTFNNDYLRKVRIDQVTPQPVSVEVKDNKLIYTFSSVQNGFIIFHVVPYKTGSQKMQVTVGAAQLNDKHFIYF